MAAPVPTYATPDQVQSIGDKYQETVKFVVDANTTVFSLLASALTRIRYIEEIIGCASVIATGGQTAALSGLPVSSTIQIQVRGRAGG